MDIIRSLQYMGFNEKEARVYATLLQLGPSTAYQIAKRSNLKRPTVYVILEELRFKDVVLKIPRAKKQIFTARPPDELIHKVVDRTNELVRLLPQLRALVANKEKPKTLYFEGLEELRQLLWYNLPQMKGKEFVGFYAHGERLSKKTLEIIDEYNNYLKINNISVRGIMPDHSSLQKYRRSDSFYNRNMKVVPFTEYSSRVSIDTGSAFVRLISYQDPQGIIIENKDMADGVKQIFEMVWKGLPTSKN